MKLEQEKNDNMMSLQTSSCHTVTYIHHTVKAHHDFSLNSNMEGSPFHVSVTRGFCIKVSERNRVLFYFMLFEKPVKMF